MDNSASRPKRSRLRPKRPLLKNEHTAKSDTPQREKTKAAYQQTTDRKVAPVNSSMNRNGDRKGRGKAKSPSAPPLPAEVLHIIFNCIIPPAFLLNSSTSLLPGNHPWRLVQRQKLALINVSRLWYRTALPFLYEAVSIRRIYQLTNLLRTLIPNSSTRFASENLKLEEVVKAVEIPCVIPARYLEQFKTQLKALLEICPKVVSCSFGSGSELPSIWISPTAALSCAALPNITTLLLNDDIPAEILHNTLHLVSAHLMALTFYIPIPDPVDNSKYTSTSPICLRRLDFLSIRTSQVSSIHYLNTFTKGWSMPRLRRLTLPGTSPLNTFLQEHGTGIRYLHITRDSQWTWLVRTFVPEISACPALEHIVLPPFYGDLAHKCVKWVDIWMPDKRPGSTDADIARDEMAKAKLPQLIGMRFLPESLQEVGDNLPLAFPPSCVMKSEDVFAYRFANVVVRHDVGKISCIRPPLAGDRIEGEIATGRKWQDHDSDFSDQEAVENDSDLDPSFVLEDSEPDSEPDADDIDSLDRSTDQDWDKAEQKLLVRESDVMDCLETDLSWLDT